MPGARDEAPCSIEGEAGRGAVNVLFWGTPEFAVPTLRAIAAAGHRVAGVVTRPDRPRGRGRKPQPSVVRGVADGEGYRVFAPESPRGDAFERAVRATCPDISVVVAYGCILTRRVLDIPRLGSLNLHASLLPKLRGAAPINWAIARGHAATGVSVMRMVEAMDAGPVLARESVTIGPDDTASSLSRDLAELGARLITEVLRALESGSVEEAEQDHAAATYAPKVDRRSARVDWTLDARMVANHIRAMDAVPGAWTLRGGDPVKVFCPRVVDDGMRAGGTGGGRGEAGEIVGADPAVGLLVATGSGVVRIGEVQPAGKRRMDAAAWLRGRPPRAGECLA